MVFSRIIFTGIPFLFLFGCSSVRHAVPLDAPAEALDNAIQEASNDPIFQNESVPEQWWLLFNDPQLNDFIETSFTRNPNLHSAQAKILSAIYNAASIRASLYPYIFWGADVSRQRLSETGVIPFSTGPAGSGTPPVAVPTTPGASSGIPLYFTLYETELNLRYNFDFWNKNRNTFRAALGQVQANIAEEAFVRLQLGILVSEAYYELQTNYKRQEIAQALVDNRTRYRNLIQKRVNANLDNQLSLQSAESNLSDAKSLLLEIQGDIAVNEYQLKAYMAGNFEEEIGQIDIVRQPLPCVPLPQDLPLHLIGKRPDIIAQIWLIESAGRQIEVAKAGFYPDFNLYAFFGFQTIHFADLFKWPSRYFNIDPAVTLPIFDAGKLMADLRFSEVNYDLAIFEYNNLVINAAKEVLDAIAVLRNVWQQQQEFENKFERQSELHHLTSLRVLHNLNSNLDELTSEWSMLKARDQEVTALGKTLKAILELIKALGGGYDNCEV